MTALSKAVKESLYLKDFKVVKKDLTHLVIASSSMIVEFTIHGENQQWLSFYVNGTISNGYCEHLVNLMNQLEEGR